VTRRRLIPFVLIFLATLSIAAWLLQRRTPEAEQLFDQAKLLDDIVAYVSRNYVDSVDQPDLYRLAIDGMLKQLGDPYTDFLEGEDVRELSMSTTGNYDGLGIRIETSDGWITVVTPLAGTPAEEAGVLAGDRIVDVEGKPTRGWTTDEAVLALRGERGSTVHLRIARPGSPTLLDFALERSPIHVNAVRHQQLVAPDIGYVWLETVSEKSAEELAGAVDSLRRRGATKMIVDLRYNPGGLLTQAIAISDLFLDNRDVVVETRGRDPRSSKVYRADGGERWKGMPVVLLVNEFSASAAEIVAGALQDHDRAVLVGSPTFGKGLVQTVFPFRRDEALKVTTGRWYTPLGRSIQRDHHDDPLTLLLGADEGVEESPDSGGRGEDTTGTTVTTPSGRVLRGKGIHPDVSALPDSASPAERAFTRALGAQVQTFRDVLTSLAIDMKDSVAVTEEGVDVTRVMRSTLFDRLTDRGVKIPTKVWDDAREVVDRELTYQMLRYGVDRGAEMRRRTSDDAIVQRAVSILESVRTMDDLLRASRDTVGVTR
jgi:carboxyl-terminal processing protease